jgi:superfamily II helicase
MSQHSHCDHCQKEQVAQPILIKHEQRWVGEFCCWECAGHWVAAARWPARKSEGAKFG